MTVILRNSSAVSPEGSQHPTTSAHPSSSILIRRMRSRNPKIHNRYFIPDGNLDLELEDGIVYRVYRYFFTQFSEDFASEYLSGPASSSFVRLKGVEAQDLDRFLSLIYPSKLGQLDISTAGEWTGVLRLADRWSFLDLRKLALEKLDALSSPAKCGVIVPNAIIPLNDRTEVARDLDGTAWSRSSPADQDDVPLLRLPTAQRIPISDAMVSIVAGQQEISEGLDAVDAVDILRSVRESMRAMLHSVSEEASLDVEQASLDVEDASLDVEQASLDVEKGSSAVEDVPASPGADPTTEAAHEPVAPHTALELSSVTYEPSSVTYEPLNIPHAPSRVTYESSSVTREPSRITREPLSTTYLLRELPFDISTPLPSFEPSLPTSFEPSLSNSFEPSLSSDQAPPRTKESIRDHHRESIQDRLQRVVGKEPPKHKPSLWSSFRRGLMDGYNSALLRNGYDRASSTNGYDGASFTNGYDGTSSTRGCDNAPSLGDSPQPNTPSSPSSPTRSEDCSSSKEDHVQAQVSSAREPEERLARSGEERVIVRRRQERMARYREEFNADLRANIERTRESVERTRESVHRARVTASRWMDIFGRTTYSSAVYER
ncbi:hypothetical protein EV714DRAFT_283919 [Schizophyllum commune]